MVFWLWYVPWMCYEFILHAMVPAIFYLFSEIINSCFSSHDSHVSLCSITACIWHWDMWRTLLLFYFAIWNCMKKYLIKHIWKQETQSQHHVQVYTFISLMLVFIHYCRQSFKITSSLTLTHNTIWGSRFFIIRHIHNHTSIISSEMQVELKKNTAFTWGKWGEKNNPQTMLLGEYSVRTGKTPQQHKSTYTT